MASTLKHVDIEQELRNEIRSFANKINKELKKDEAIKKYNLTIDPKDRADLFKKTANGVLLCHIINKIEPDTIPTKMINYGYPDAEPPMHPFKVVDNLNLAINSANAMGIKTMGATYSTITQGSVAIVLGLIWQMVEKLSLKDVNAIKHPGLINIVPGDKHIGEYSEEELLLMWVNHHLEKNELYDGKKVTNLDKDFQDGSVYIALMKQVQPDDLMPPFTMAKFKADTCERRIEVVKMAERIGLDEFIDVEDMENGEKKSTTIFLAELFNLHPALGEDDCEAWIDPDGTEEKTYKNWINSIGLDGVKPMTLFYPPMMNGLTYLKIMDLLEPGIVDWKRVPTEEQMNNRLRGPMLKMINVNYVIETATKMKNVEIISFSKDHILKGDPKMSKALTWQLLSIYTLSVIQDFLGEDVTSPRAVENKIIKWAQEKLISADKTSTFRNFADTSLADGKVLADLCDAIQPGSVKYEYLSGIPQEDIKYILAVCKMIGAKIYASAFHFEEETFDRKMVLTVFACLMKVDLVDKKKDKDDKDDCTC